jgi:MFS family permease
MGNPACPPPAAGDRRRWLALVAGTAALTAGSAFQYGLAYLIPALRAQGLSLEQAGLLVAVLAVAAVLVVSTNGLSFTAVAELAGPAWAGRALGIQNTGQNLAAALTPPAMAAVIAAAGYPVAFAVAGLFPLAAALVIPVTAERGTPGGRRPAPAPAGSAGAGG